MFKKGNIFKKKVTGGIVSPEAKTVLNRYSALTNIEEEAIINLINPFSAALGDNTWAQVQQVWSLSLNATDRLIPFKTGDTAINNGCTFDINGASDRTEILTRLKNITL